MKKNYLILLSFLLPYLMYSQLNGNYTIGETGADYTSMGEALLDLETIGVSGAVTFNIKDGTYNEQGLNISDIPGVSSTNNVTFQSENLNAENVILDGNNILEIANAAQHISFNYLKFYTYSSFNSSRNAIRVYSDNISITNCIFSGGTSVSSDYFFDGNSAKLKHSFLLIDGDNITINNNLFLTIGSAICRITTTTSTYNQNLSIINNMMNGNMVAPIVLNKINNLIVNGNQFQGTIKYRPIQASNLSGQTEIKNNNIHSSNSELEYGLSITLNGSANGGDITVANNFIATKNGVSLRYFNNYNVTNNSFYADEDQCITFYADDYLQNFDLYNNIFYTQLGTPDLKIFQTYDLTKLNANNNAFSKQDGVIFHAISGTFGTFFNLNDWNTFSGNDSNSMVTELIFTSDTDLHTPNAIMLDGAGRSIIADLGFDIDNDPRSLSAPDIGADEFDMDYSTFLDLEIVEIISPTNALCEDSGIILSIKNNSSTIINSFDVECALNDYRGNISNYILTINPNETINVTLDNCQIIKNTFYDKFEFYISNPNGMLDNNYSNNILTTSNIFQLGDFDITVENNGCIGSYDLSIPLISDTTVSWSTGETSNNITVTSTGEYSVTVTDAQGCQIIKSITLN